MTDIDAVAQAICNEFWDGSPIWEGTHDKAREKWRRTAQVAVEALQLTREVGFMSEYPEGDLFENEHGHILARRLVGPWVRCQEDQ